MPEQRRVRGTGSVSQRGRGRWLLRVSLPPDPDGKRGRLTRTVAGSKVEAHRELTKMVGEAQGYVEPVDATVAELLEAWYAHASPSWSPSTAVMTRRMVDTLLVPRIGDLPIVAVTTASLDAFYAQLSHGGAVRGGPLAASTVRRVHGVLRRALGQAVRWGWLTHNPAVMATPPTPGPASAVAPTAADVARVLDAAGRFRAEFGTFVHLAATTGARRGELCGLRWTDIDLNTGTLHIRRRIVSAPGNTQVELPATKSGRSRRIALSSPTVKELQNHKARCTEGALATNSTLTDDAFVFSPSPDRSQPHTLSTVTRNFARARQAAGIAGMRLHDLRHFAASQMLAAGVPVTTVAERLGHASSNMTLAVYAHFVPETDRHAAEVLGEVLTKAQAEAHNVVDGGENV